MAVGAEYLFQMKSIETHARAFMPLNISAISGVVTIRNHLRRLDVNPYVTLKVHASIPDTNMPQGKHIAAKIIIP